MRIQAALLLLASSVLPSSLAIFVDEAYNIDYQHALLGIPQARSTFFHRPSSSSNASLLYTISEKNILGAVKPKDGSIVWRQDLSRSSPESASFLRAADGQDTVISAVGGEVAAWIASDGKQVWENRFGSGPVVDLELAESSQDQPARDTIVLTGGKAGVVRRLDGTNGNVRWEFKDDRYGDDTAGLNVFLVKAMLIRRAVVMSRSRFPLLPQMFITSHYNLPFWEAIKLRPPH